MFRKFKGPIKNFAIRSLFFNHKWFSSGKVEDFIELSLKPITKTLFKKLKSMNDEYLQLTNRLTNNNANISSGEIQQIRKQTEENSRFHELYLEFESIIKSKQELKKMEDEANNDKETIDFVKEEMKSYDEKLEDVQERAVELLIPADKYDDCNSIKIEIRSGIE